jgi:hypothetical protein
MVCVEVDRDDEPPNQKSIFTAIDAFKPVSRPALISSDQPASKVNIIEIRTASEFVYAITIEITGVGRSSRPSVIEIQADSESIWAQQLRSDCYDINPLLVLQYC